MIRLSLATAVALAGLAAPAMAQAVSYQISNQTGLTLMEFYASPASTGEMGGGNDILGAGVVAPGESGTVSIAQAPGECLYDLRSVFEDGSERVETQDICQSASYTLTQ